MKAGGFRALGLAAGLLLAAAVQASVKLRGDIGQGNYRKRDGWSVAQDRRNARNARNRARNRAAHR